MKKVLLIILLLLPLVGKGSEPIRIGVITDTHYLSEKLIRDGEAIDKYVQSSGKDIRYVPFVLDKVLDEYSNSNINVLLITGDLTKDGEKQSHIDFAQKLIPLRNKGVKIYVIPGNHDINMTKAVGFNKNETYSTPGITPNEFAEIYKDYGYSDVAERDSASLSYVTHLDNDTWLLAIDAAKYAEKTTSSGRILPTTESWIIKILQEAKNRNKQVIAMMHWGVTEHIMYQSEFFGNYLVDDWQRIAPLLADNGVKAIFTGHFHANDITMYKSPDGNKLYDIETGTLSSYPYAYRFVDLHKGKMDITTKNITSIPQKPDLAEESKQTLRQLAESQAKSRFNKLGFDIPEFLSQPLTEAISRIFITHLGGDEQIDDETLSILEGLSFILGDSLDAKEVNLDYYPADNNVSINF